MSGPTKALAADAGLAGGKRFRFTGLHTRLGQADAHPVALQTVPTADAEVDAESSHLKSALSALAERNLSDHFTRFANDIRPRTLSLALVLRGRSWLVNHACEAIRSAAREQHLAVEPIALCIAALARDLGISYFLPFFPTVVTAFADVFSGENSTALFWDPELVLLPVFSALTAITKILVLRLVANPVVTLVQIAPLLGHEHYRVREMTAESCLGYIMRKTRQADALDGLVKAAMGCAEGLQIPRGKRIEQVPIVHGAGAAIFEAMRLPSGGLHARAMRVLCTALQYTGTCTSTAKPVTVATPRRSRRLHSTATPVKPATDLHQQKGERAGSWRFRYAILVHAVARVCGHVKQKPKSASDIVEAIVGHGDKGIEDNNAEAVADSMFLLRNCLNGTVSFSTTVLPDAYVQRIANLVIQCIPSFPEDQRSCYEAFECYIAILQRTLAQRSHRVTVAMTKLLSSVVDEISLESAVAMLRTLCALVDKAARKSVNTDELLPIVALLSNALSKRSGAMADALRKELTKNSGLQAESLSSPYFVALFSAVKFVELSQTKAVTFDAPDLDKEVVLGLDAVVSLLEEKNNDFPNFHSTEPKVPFPALMQILLQYTRLVEVPATAPHMARLAAIPMRQELLAMVASSILRYELFSFKLRSGDMEEKLHGIVRSLLQNLRNGIVCGNVLSAINAFIRKHNASTLFEGLSEVAVHQILDLLCSNLSCSTARVRTECAILLREISVSMSSVDVENENMQDINTSCLTDDATDIRSRLAEPRETVCPDELIFSAILCVLTVPHQLDGITTVREIMGQLGKLTRIAGRISPRARTALCHFSVGVFCIRFRPLWEPARILWGALAEVNEKEPWVPMSHALVSTCGTVLAQFSPNRSAAGKTEAGAGSVNESDDEDSADEDTSGRIEHSRTKYKAPSSLSRKRPRHARKAETSNPDKKPNRTRATEQDGVRGSRKKQKLMSTQGTFILSWRFDEWKSHLTSEMTSTSQNGLIVSDIGAMKSDDRNAAVEALTRHTEYIKVLSEYPKTTLHMRSFIIDRLYLTLEPSSLSRKTGDVLIKQYGALMEKMGGLKICENDKERYQRLHARLLRDLCRPSPGAQAEVLRCLCASRSPELKPYKASLLRIVAHETFREELSLLTDTLSAKGTAETQEKQSRLELSDSMVDVLVRLCYSKIRGKGQRLSSRRSAAISFVVTSLPWKTAVPKLAGLALGGMASFVDGVCPRAVLEAEDLNVDFSGRLTTFPPENVCRGVLKSLDSMIRQLRGSIPIATWRQIAVALFVVLSASTRLRQGQDIRSDALRLLATMLEQERERTAFVCMPVLQTMSEFQFDLSGAENVTAAPAFLKFLTACFRCLSEESITLIVTRHKWACDWALRILRSESCSPQTVELVIDIALGVIALKNKSSECAATLKPLEQGEDLINVLSDSLRTRLDYLQEASDSNWHRQKSNRDSVESVMKVLSEIGACVQLERGLMQSLADSLLYIITESRLYGSPLVASIYAFGSLVKRITSAPPDEAATANHSIELKFVPRIVPLFSSPSSAKQLDAKEGLCNALCNFGNNGLRMMSYLVQDTMAMNTRRIGEADLDTRVQAFTSVIKILKRAVRDDPSSEETSGGICIFKSDVTLSKSFLASGQEVAELPASASCTPSVILLIAHAAIAAIQDEDVSVRGTASFSLHLLSKWISASNAMDSRSIGNTLGSVLVREVTSACSVAARREYSRILGNLVRNPSAAVQDDQSQHSSELLLSLRHFADLDNIETDFFENIVHLQVHRRSRAMRRLTKKLAEMNGNETGTICLREGIRQFVFPLTMRVALEAGLESSGVSASSRRSKESKEGYLRDVTSAAISLNQAAVCFLAWQDYRKEIVSIIRRIPKEHDDSRAEALYSLLVGFATAFPGASFGQKEEDGTRAAQERFLRTHILPKMILFISSGAVEGEVNVVLNNSKAEKTNGGDRSQNAIIFRAPVAVAAARLISQLDDQELSNRMPALIAPLANALRSRLFAVRTAAKKALVEVVLLLDPKFFSYTVDQVLSALVRGYRKDSVVYVVHALLSGIRDHRSNEMDGVKGAFPIDTAVKRLCDALAEELEDGLHVSQTDYVNPNATGSRLREATHRAIRVTEAAEILSELIDFSQNAEVVLKPFVDRLIGATSAKLSCRLTDALQKLILGFSRNQSITGADGLKLAFRLVSSNMPSPNLFSDAHEEDGSTAALRDQLQSMVENRTFSNAPNSHAVAELGWQLLNNLLSKGIVNANGNSACDRKAQAMLEPFVPELILSMRSRYDSLTRIALKCAQRLLRLPIASRNEVADVMAATTVEVLSRNLGVSINPGAPLAPMSGSQEDGLFNTCLRAAAVLIQEVGQHEKRGVKTKRVQALLKIARNVLDQNSVEARSAALVLIRSTVSARISLPDVYDTVEHVSKLAVRAQSASLRSACKNISVQFLINFPLGNKRIKQHLEFFVRNLSYEHPHGRMASIDVIEAIIEKLPEKNLVEESEYFFISLISVVARDGDQLCRKAAAEAVKTLFATIGNGRSFSALLSMSQALVATGRKKNGSGEHSDPDADILRSGAVALSSAAQCKKLSNGQVQSSLEVVVSVLSAKTTLPWETVYALLCCTEQLFSVQSEEGRMEESCELQVTLKPFWESIELYLLYSHEWIRHVAARLLGRHLSAAGGRDAAVANANKKLYSVLWARNGTLRDILRTLCLQFEAKQLSDALAKQTLKNLLCVANMVWKCPNAGNVSEEKMKLISHEQDDTIMNEDAKVGEDTNRPLTWLLTRVSGLCIRVGKEDSALLRRACGIRFLLVANKWWGAEVVKPRLQNFVSPIVRILETKSNAPKAKPYATGTVSKTEVSGDEPSAGVDGEQNGAGIDMDGLRVLALSLQEALVATVGADEYFQVYQTLVAKRKAAKDEKKRVAAIQIAIDPERAAKRRRQKAESRAQRRRNDPKNVKYGTRVAKASFQVFEKNSNSLREEE